MNAAVVVRTSALILANFLVLQAARGFLAKPQSGKNLEEEGRGPASSDLEAKDVEGRPASSDLEARNFLQVTDRISKQKTSRGKRAFLKAAVSADSYVPSVPPVSSRVGNGLA